MTTSPSDSPLAALQARMQAHVLTGDLAALGDVLQTQGLDAARRLGIYHHAYRARLLETLRDTFGHTLRYLGDDWFDHLAGAFVAQHPHSQRNLRWYGREWPDWLAATLVADSDAGAHPEVAELARLDWAMRQAFDAADAEVLTLAHLGRIAPEDWDAAVLPTQPAMQMLNLAHNTLSLWHALDQDQPVPEAVRLDEPMDVLVWRREERPHFRSVTPTEALGLRSLQAGQSFGELCAALAPHGADEAEATQAAAALLRRCVEDGVLVAMPVMRG